MSKFLSYILNLRGIAIFIVVGVHARGNVSDWSSPGIHDFLSTLFEAREGNGTVMFIFIGGFLFQYITHKSFDFKKYIEKKFLFVILPYILISIPVIAFRIYSNYDFALPPGFNHQSVLFKFFYYILTGLHLAPFWFISTIALFYISAPFFHALDNRKFYQYVFPFLILVCLFTYRSAHNANPLFSYAHYFPVYILGMWACFYRNRILSAGSLLLYPLMLIYVGLMVGHFTGWIPIAERTSFEEILKNGIIVFNMDLFKAIIFCFILMLLLYRFKEKKLLFFEILGEYSFGIFFIHCIYIFASRKIWTDIFGPISFTLPTFIFYFSFILLASIGTVYLIKRYTGRYSRNLIGS